MRDKACPQCRWVSVVDGAGRRRLGMRWNLPIAAPAQTSVSRAA